MGLEDPALSRPKTARRKSGSRMAILVKKESKSDLPQTHSASAIIGWRLSALTPPSI
jgi:hypothetical protein